MHDGSRSRRARDQKEIGREVKTSVKCNRKTENEQIRRESSKKQGDSLESDFELKDKEMYDLKHELISAQIKLENAEKQGKELQKQLNEDAKKIVRLETELKDK